ncbi:MAG: NADH-quinone oxidoreductase subunit NuoK [Deltaproteobacteria bacterium]|nr:MAG: NADH-quinone oxidoreductase subunit NuoK [Deltaproteobacteria bacterium]
MILLSHYIVVSAILFSIGVIGVLCRRNALVIFMSVEIMLNAANLAFIAFAREHGGMEGQTIAFFVMALAAAEVAVGLGIIMAVFKKQGTIDLAKINFLKG